MAVFFIASSAILFLCAVHAAEIKVGVPAPASSGGVDVAVTVTPAERESVSAVQFDFQYDASRYGFTDVTAGLMATAAGKDATFSEPVPGVVRVIVAGFNQEPIGSGTVATLHFDPLEKTQPSSTFAATYALDSVVVSDPRGENNEAIVVNPAVSNDEPARETSQENNGPAQSATSGPQGDVKQSAVSSVPVSAHAESALSAAPRIASESSSGAVNKVGQSRDPASASRSVPGSARPFVSGEALETRSQNDTGPLEPSSRQERSESAGHVASRKLPAGDSAEFAPPRHSSWENPGKPSSKTPAGTSAGNEPMQLASAASAIVRTKASVTIQPRMPETGRDTRLGWEPKRSAIVISGIVLAALFACSAWYLRND